MQQLVGGQLKWRFQQSDIMATTGESSPTMRQDESLSAPALCVHILAYKYKKSSLMAPYIQSVSPELNADDCSFYPNTLNMRTTINWPQTSQEGDAAHSSNTLTAQLALHTFYIQNCDFCPVEWRQISEEAKWGQNL